MSINHYQLYVTTKNQIAEARADARAGRRDAARNVLRFVRNARIADIITNFEFPPGLSTDAALLRWEISQLETECHPSAPCDQTDDIKAIRAQLDIIAHYVSQQIGGAK